MEVTCIDNEGCEKNLTIGKKYQATEVGDEYYHVKHDRGEYGNYFKHRFSPVSTRAILSKLIKLCNEFPDKSFKDILIAIFKYGDMDLVNFSNESFLIAINRLFAILKEE